LTGYWLPVQAKDKLRQYDEKVELDSRLRGKDGYGNDRGSLFDIHITATFSASMHIIY